MLLDPVATLHQRKEFLGGVQEIARLCNWGEKDIQGLLEHIWEELIKIDNTTFLIFIETKDQEYALSIWNDSMESLRYWLTLMLGIKIKYI